MTKDEALRLALGALESKDGWGSSVRDAKEKAITAIKAALEAKDEPVAFENWLSRNCPSGDAESVQRQWESSSDYADLYTTPPQRTWVGLTDEEIEQGCKESWVTEQAFQSAVWWAEAKLKERNT